MEQNGWVNNIIAHTLVFEARKQSFTDFNYVTCAEI